MAKKGAAGATLSTYRQQAAGCSEQKRGSGGSREGRGRGPCMAFLQTAGDGTGDSQNWAAGGRGSGEWPLLLPFVASALGCGSGGMEGDKIQRPGWTGVKWHGFVCWRGRGAAWVGEKQGRRARAGRSNRVWCLYKGQASAGQGAGGRGTGVCAQRRAQCCDFGGAVLGSSLIYGACRQVADAGNGARATRGAWAAALW